MKISQIDQFFRTLDEMLGKQAEVIMIGAAAGALMGHVRPSSDIDFEIRLEPKPSAEEGEWLAECIRNASAKVGLAAQYSEDISHWSFISLLDYRKTAAPYKTFGKIRVKLISPECWTIGKMGRFLQLDIMDIISIIRLKKLTPEKQIRVWTASLKDSMLSLDKGRYMRNIEYFIKHHGKEAWGNDFESAKWLSHFKNNRKRE